MDPFSISIGVTTIIGVAVDVAKRIQTLREVQNLPEDFKVVLEEVLELQHQLEVCRSHLTGLHSERVQSEGPHFVMLCKKAKAKLERLEDELGASTCLDGLARMQKLKVFWAGMIDGKARLRKTKEEVRDIRLALVQALASLTAPVVYRVDTKVDHIKGAQEEIQLTQQKILDTVITLCERVPKQPPSYETSISVTNTTSLVLSRPGPIPKMTRQKPAPRAVIANTKSAQNMSELDLPTNIFRVTCKPWCSCRCHATSDWQSPHSLQSFFGALSINHSGVDMLTKTCNESQCRRALSPKMSFRYRFPKTIANLQYLICSFNFLAGVEIRVKLPRIRDWTSPVWQYATVGNVEAIASLFKHGLASPWDVSPIGGNLLHYATDHWNSQLCKLLLDADLEPEAQDDLQNTAVGIAWERVLSGQMTADEASTVASLFVNSDFLSTRSFTVIHKIVLGLVSKDLDYELECSSADINKQDSVGRTPLSWASARGDEHAIRILLKHKADVNLPDIKGNQPLHYVRDMPCAQLLLDARANLHALNNDKQAPLYMACRYFQDASLVRFLIRSGSDVNAQDIAEQTAMHNLGGEERMQFVNILLDEGADINIGNGMGDTALRFAILYNVHSILRRMLRERVDAYFGGINGNGQSFAHAIVMTADVETIQILTEARPASLDPDLGLRDKAGKTAEDYLNDRLNLLEDEEAAELRDAFQKLVMAIFHPREFSAATPPMAVVEADDKIEIVIHGIEVTADDDQEEIRETAVSDVFFDAVEII